MVARPEKDEAAIAAVAAENVRAAAAEAGEASARSTGDAVRPTFTSIPAIDFCGHSIPAAGGTKGGDHHAYPDRLAKLLGARERRNIANGGSIACWPQANAAGDGGREWMANNFMPPTADGAPYLPRTTVAVVHAVQNDLGALGGNTPRPMQEALRYELSRYCASTQFPDSHSSFTYGSAVQTVANAIHLNGQEHFIPPGAANPTTEWEQFAVPADYKAGCVVTLAVGVVPGAPGTPATANLGITVDGVPQADYVLNYSQNGQADAENGKYGMVALRFGRADCGLGIPLTDGAHTIRISRKSSNPSPGGYVLFQGGWIEADPLDGPLLVVPSTYRCTSPTLGGYALWSASTHGPSASTDPLTDASVAKWKTAEQQVLADFPGRALYVDIDAVLNKDSQWFYINGVGDGAHPTNAGHALIAQTIYDAIIASGLLTSRRIARTDRLGGYNGYGGGLWRPVGGAFGTSIGLAFANGWVNFGAPNVLSAYRKDLDGRVHMRGLVKQAGAGAASSLITAALGAGYRPEAQKDAPNEVYDGTSIAIGGLRMDGSGQLAFVFNGKTNATGFNFITHEWMAER